MTHMEDLPQNKFRFLERPFGFRIESDHRVPVNVSLADTGFWVDDGRVRQQMLFETIGPDGSLVRRQPDVTLYCFRELLNKVVAIVVDEWRPARASRSFLGRDTLAPSEQSHDDFVYYTPRWAKEVTKRALCKGLHVQWRRLVAKADATVAAVQRAVFAAAFGGPAVLHCTEIYRDRYIVSDVMRYRAAALVLANIHDLVEAWWDDIVPRRTFKLIRPHQDFECPLGGGYFPWGLSTIVERLGDWQGLLARSNGWAAYRSLSRTLMNLPGGVPGALLPALQDLELDAPVLDRVKLVTLLLAKSRLDACANERAQRLVRLFLHAQRSQIIEVMRWVADATYNELSPRRTYDIGIAVDYLCDYPEIHRGTLTGLARRAIAWHALPTEEHKLPRSTPTALPLIPLPTAEGVRLLETVGEIVDEGHAMRHCVATRAASAMRGESHLFHIDYGGESATTEVDGAGRVRESKGPGNRVNAASQFAERVLAVWGRRLRPAATRSDPHGDA